MFHCNSTFIKFALATLLLIFVLSGCGGDGNSNRPVTPTPTPSPSPSTTTVSKLPSLIKLQVDCGDYAELWVGPSSNISVKLTGSETCPVTLQLEDKVTHKLQPTGNSSMNPAGAPPVTVHVTDRFVLICDCGGNGNNKCACEITQVDPDLPAGTVAGTPATITAGPAQNNPTAAPAAGTPVTLDCGKQNLPLWAGKKSYVTVTFQGTQNCTAHVTGRMTGQAGSEETVDKDPFCRTFGPITELTASCIGGGNQKCSFQVTQVAEVPQ